MYALIYGLATYFQNLNVIYSNIPGILVFFTSLFIDKPVAALSVVNMSISLLINVIVDMNVITIPMTLTSHLISLPYLYLCFFIQSTLFYTIHRILHWKWFFQHIHSFHHRHITDGWWTAFYFHPIELLMVLFTFQAPKFLSLYIPMPIALLTFWNVASSLNFMFSHGKKPLVNLRNHWLHHTYYNCNYSSEWIDRLCGTYLE